MYDYVPTKLETYVTKYRNFYDARQGMLLYSSSIATTSGHKHQHTPALSGPSR